MESWEVQISAVAALDGPTRRRLYGYVVRQREPVSHDDAAAAVKLPRKTATFHLDRLVGEGLLDVVYQRLTGRTDPWRGAAGQAVPAVGSARGRVAAPAPL